VNVKNTITNASPEAAATKKLAEKKTTYATNGSRAIQLIARDDLRVNMFTFLCVTQKVFLMRQSPNT
jgi:hypothetical protein